MAPDRGEEDESLHYNQTPRNSCDGLTMSRTTTHQKTMEPQHFTVRGILVGLVIGVIICFSNMYFGLQTGWISSMAMPSALLGFSYFKLVSRYIAYPFSQVENVLVQSVAGSVGTMPLGCGFVGVIPALNFLLKSSENGPLDLSLTKLIVWSLGIAFFGVVFAVPLRRQVILREQLKFPSGTAAAALIGLLHGKESADLVENTTAGRLSRSTTHELPERDTEPVVQGRVDVTSTDEEASHPEDWKKRLRFLTYSFGFSAVYTVFSYFVPLNNVPLFGSYLANKWLWTVNFSPAYVGQGIIMGPQTTFSMLLGAVVGYAFLSPLAKNQGWAPGPTEDWATGSKGWIVWISLAIMLVDSLINLGWLLLRPLLRLRLNAVPSWKDLNSVNGWKNIVSNSEDARYTAIGDEVHSSSSGGLDDTYEDCAPSHHQISIRVTIIGLVLSCIACVGGVHYAFANLIPLGLTLVALIFAMLLSVMGVRALGETDLNPVSGISKLTQLIFAFFTPRGSKNGVIINLIAGALSESGALQAGDLMQDLKTGHLLQASPKAQFYGQIIGSAVGAVISAVIYKLYTRVYEIPGELFEVPTAYVWINTARLVTGQGLPPKVPEWAWGAAVLFAVSTSTRIWLNLGGPRRKQLASWIPGGIAVAVGEYLVIFS